MKTARYLTCAALACATSIAAEGSLQRTLKAFEDKPGYVQPLATWFGTFTNQNWITSARVNAGYSWQFSFPAASLGFLSTDDHTYTRHFTTGCAEVRAAGFQCPAPDVEDYEVPTILGPKTNTIYYSYYLEPNDQGYTQNKDATADDGDKTLRKISTLGTLWPQLSLSYQHARLTLRALPLSWVNIEEFGGYSHFGFGLQYSLGHLFAHHLPASHPLDVSLTTNYNFISLGYKPKDYAGELNLDFVTQWHALVLGTRLGEHFEIFTELGFERSSLEASGELHAKVEGEDDIKPSVETDGRNGFKASINIALHFGKWHPSIGASQGAQTGIGLNLLNFGKEGTP